MIESKYSKRLKHFLENEHPKLLGCFPHLFFCRNDGVILYEHKKADHFIDSSGVGALMGGLWHAAEALMSFVPANPEQSEIFRLSFDTSSRGVHILPFSIKGRGYLFGTIFFEEENPAIIKNNMRNLLAKIEIFFENESFVNTKQEEKADPFLFKNISDDEVDKLFSFGEH